MSLAYPASSAANAVLSKAVVRAAERLKIRQAEIAAVIGVSPSVASRLFGGDALPQAGKALELSILFVRVFRALDAIVGGDEAVAATWLRQPNSALGAIPIELMKTIVGLTSTLSYLDSRRALV